MHGSALLQCVSVLHGLFPGPSGMLHCQLMDEICNALGPPPLMVSLAAP